MDKEIYKKLIKNKILQTVIETENPMSGTPFEGAGYVKILGDVVEELRSKMIENASNLKHIGDSTEITEMLIDIHISIQEELVNK